MISINTFPDFPIKYRRKFHIIVKFFFSIIDDLLMSGSKLFSILIFAFFLLIYALSIPEALSVAHDSIQYIFDIEKGTDIFHPHHLLFTPIVRVWAELMSAVFGINDTSFSTGIINSLFGAMGVMFIFKILAEVFKIKNVAASLWASIAGLNFGYWFYSICVEIYIIPLGLVLAGIYYLCKSDYKGKWFLVSAGLLGFSVLVHQLHILFIFPLLFIFANNFKKIGIKSILLYLAVYLSIIAIGYFYVIFAVKNLYTFDDIIYWLTFYTHVLPSWNEPEASGFLKILIGFVRSFIATQPFLVSPETSGLMKAFFAQKSLEDDSYLLRSLSQGTIYIYLFAVAALLSLIIYFFIKATGNLRSQAKKNKEILIFVAAFIVYSIFFSFWNPENLEFWIPQNVFLWIMLAVFLKDKTNKFMLPALAILIAGLNWFFLISRTGNIDNDYYYTKVKKIESASKNNDLILLENKWIDWYYFDKFTDIDKLSLNQYPGDHEDEFDPIGYIEKKLDRGNRVYMVDNLIQNSPDEYSHELSRFRSRLDSIEHKFFKVYVLK